MASKNFRRSLEKNIGAYMHYLDLFTLLAQIRFNWNSLPLEIPSDIIESVLIEKGKIAFFKDDIADFFAVLPFTIRGRLDIYNNPINIMVYANNGYKQNLQNNKNAVVIFNNSLHKPLLPVLMYYAKQIAEIDLVAEMNLKAQKTPYVLKCKKENQLTVENYYSKIDGNEPVIIQSDSFDNSDIIQVFKTDIPFICNNLYQYKQQLINEVCINLGYSNIMNGKKERQTSLESINGIEQVSAYRVIGEKTRQEACEKINKIFGLNMSVTFNSDIDILTLFKNEISAENPLNKKLSEVEVL